MQSYERLGAWERSHQLALAIFRNSARWPATERYGLVAQIRRAAFSVPTNIAEGSAKRGKAEFRRFLDIAVGSLAEVSYLLRLARDVGIIEPDDWALLESLRDKAGRATWLLYKSMAP